MNIYANINGHEINQKAEVNSLQITRVVQDCPHCGKEVVSHCVLGLTDGPMHKEKD